MTPKETKPNDAAFARPSFYHDSYGRPDQEQDGLTKREYFAAMAMQGWLANEYIGTKYDIIAQHCVRMADALIEELNKEK
jgi:hypothetical protein